MIFEWKANKNLFIYKKLSIDSNLILFNCFNIVLVNFSTTCKSRKQLNNLFAHFVLFEIFS